MKSSLATSLSIAGVLATGGVAMALNSAVLSSPSNDDLVQQVLQQASPTTTVPGGVVEAAATAGSPASESVTTTFTIGAAGTVTVAVAGSTLEVTDITVGDGWTASPPRYADISHAKVHFTSTAQRLEVKIALVDGVAQVTVENDPTGPGGGVPAPEVEHDDDDHEEHEEHEEHEDGDHEEEGDDD